MAHEDDGRINPESTRHEVRGWVHHLWETVFVTIGVVTLAIIFHMLFSLILPETELKFSKDVPLVDQQNLEIQHLHVEMTVAILREVLSGLAAILISFVAYIVWNLTNLLLQQSNILANAHDLKKRFIDIQTRDNIIVPSGSNSRVISVATLSNIPDPIELVWNKKFAKCGVPAPPPPVRAPNSLFGCTILFWPSIDDVINSPAYIEYFASTINMDFFRILVTAKPKHKQGLEVYLALAGHFRSRIYVIDQDKWYNDIRAAFERSPHVVKKGKVLNLLRSQVEIVTDTPIADFTASKDQNWLVRYLHSEPSVTDRDPRARLAQPDAQIETMASCDPLEDGFQQRVAAAARFLNAIEASGVYRDATTDGDIDSLFATAVPRSVIDVILSCHASAP